MIEKDTPTGVHFVAVVAAVTSGMRNETMITLSDGSYCLKARVADSEDT